MDMYDNGNFKDQAPSYFVCGVDANTIKLSQSARLKLKALKAMDELTGWCTKSKAAILIDLVMEAKAQTVVEIGVWGGRSLVPMAFALKELGHGTAFGIDPWSATASAEGMTGVNEEWWTMVDHEAIYQGLVNKIAKFGLKNSVELLRYTSEKAPPIVDIDILHIDGNHSDKTSYFDVTKWAPLVRNGGYIVFDDITWGTTTRAVDWLNANCIKVAQYHDDCDWGIWYKP